MLRVWGLGLAAALLWALAFYHVGRPAPRPADAPPRVFSAARAQAALAGLLAPERPHPLGSAENARLRARLVQALAQRGVTAQPLTAMSCYGEARWNALTCGTVHDLVAPVLPGQGAAILLMAHLDSVPAGPGAGDDGSGVAILLETIRALRADPEPARGHPVLALFTDGEEFGMLGAAAFLRDPAWRRRVGMVVNAEARGDGGPSYLFQTSPGDGRLVSLYARSARSAATSSLYAEIYRRLPNDTDLTPFLAAGVPGYNFAFIGDSAAYHTPLDRLARLDPRSIQHQGENVLGLTRALRAADFDALHSGDAIYLDLFGLAVPRLPAPFALPLALGIFAVLLALAWRRRSMERVARDAGWTWSGPPLLWLGAVASGFLLHGLAALLAGTPDPSFAHPWALRIALAFGVWSMVLMAMRRAGFYACWLWLAALGIVTAWLAPGASPYFLFPGMLAAGLLLFGDGLLLRFLAALAALIVWLGLAAQGEAVAGLAAHPLFTLPSALGLTALLPLLAPRAVPEQAWRLSLFLSAGIALAFAVLAGLLPVYSSVSPQRLTLHYVESGGRAFWLADPAGRLPDALRRAAGFSDAARTIAGLGGYVAPAGPARAPAPAATVLRQGRDITIRLPDDGADGYQLILPSAMGSTSIDLAGLTKTVAPGARFSCVTPDCGGRRVTLNPHADRPLLLVEERRGLPPDAPARPGWTVPSQFGDTSLRAVSLP